MFRSIRRLRRKMIISSQIKLFLFEFFNSFPSLIFEHCDLTFETPLVYSYGPVHIILLHYCSILYSCMNQYMCCINLFKYYYILFVWYYFSEKYGNRIGDVPTWGLFMFFYIIWNIFLLYCMEGMSCKNFISGFRSACKILPEYENCASFHVFTSML